MFATLPLLLLAVAVILVAAMAWRRPHPNHLFFLELLKNHLQEEPELKSDPAEQAKSGDGTATA
jgi:hypothetical protein